MIPEIKKTMLALSVLCLVALPAAAHEVEGPQLFSFTAVVEFVVDHIQRLVANFGPGMEPHGLPADTARDTTESDAGTPIEEDDGLPDIGPGLEPHG